MNEAENSNSPDLFESNDSQSVSAQVGDGVASSIAAQAPEAEWETINLPNALSVDDIPQESEPTVDSEVHRLQKHVQTLEHQQTAAIDHIQTLEQHHAIAADHIRDLKQQNSELVNQVSQFETALEQARKAMRLERRRWKAQIISQMAQAEERSQAQAAITLQKEQALADTQEQATKLLQELEQSHQIGQRQQILIQTLTEQLEASQEQVAQLERECAATQQRYDEQIQFVRQAETACRDLRSRLHRQQRYTLQFKAALEKCLDVSATQSEVVTTSEVALSSTAEPDAFVQLFAPKAQPVQPWSAQPAVSEIEASEVYSQIGSYASWTVPESLSSFQEAALSSEPNSLADAVVSDTELIEPQAPTSVVHPPKPSIQPSPVSYTIERSGAEADEESLEDANHWEIELFQPQFATVPESVEQATTDPGDKSELASAASTVESHADSESAESDLDQKLEAALQTFDDTQTLEEAESNRSISESTVVSVADGSDDFLWNDLEALIEAPTASAPPELPAESLPASVDEPTEVTSQPAAGVESRVAPSFMTPFEQVMMDHFAPKSDLVPTASAFTTLESVDSQAIESISEPEAVEASTAFQSNGPSPIVYPLRSPKKLKSLAAVDLPSFPRRGS